MSTPDDGTDDRAKPTYINLAALSTASVETDDGQTVLTLTMLALQPGKERPHAQKLRVSGADAERLERALRRYAGAEPAG